MILFNVSRTINNVRSKIKNRIRTKRTQKIRRINWEKKTERDRNRNEEIECGEECPFALLKFDVDSHSRNRTQKIYYAPHNLDQRRSPPGHTDFHFESFTQCSQLSLLLPLVLWFRLWSSTHTFTFNRVDERAPFNVATRTKN